MERVWAVGNLKPILGRCFLKLSLSGNLVRFPKTFHRSRINFSPRTFFLAVDVPVFHCSNSGKAEQKLRTAIKNLTITAQFSWVFYRVVLMEVSWLALRWSPTAGWFSLKQKRNWAFNFDLTDKV